MITARIGDRIVRRRRGCKAEHGTIIKVYTAGLHQWAGWLKVAWDSGATCHVHPGEGGLAVLNRGAK